MNYLNEHSVIRIRLILTGVLLLLLTGCGTMHRVKSTTVQALQQCTSEEPGYTLRLSPYYKSDDDGSGHRVKAKARGHMELNGVQELWGIPTKEPLRGVTPRDNRFRPWVSPEAGLGWDHGPEGYAGLKMGLTLDAKHWRLRLEERPRWDSDHGFVNINRVDWRYEWTDTVRLQAASQIRWFVERDDALAWQQIQVHQNLPKREQVGARLIAYETWEEDWRYSGTALRAFYRMEIEKNKYYLHVEPGLSIREEKDWDLDPTLFIRFDMLFGNRSDTEVDHIYQDF